MPGPQELIVLLLMLSVVFIIVIIPFWKIFSKTGQSGALALFMCIPLINVIMLFVLAFSEWPIEKELEQLRNK